MLEFTLNMSGQFPKGGADDAAMLSIQTNDKLISDPTVLYV